MPVEFRYARLDEYERVAAFVDQNWARNHIYVRDRALFDWTFGPKRHWEQDSYSVAVGEEGGELVGILGGIPFAFNRCGRVAPGVWIVNYVVRADHRRGPTALQLLSMFRRPPYAATIAFGINPATASIYRVLRGEVLPEIPRHFLVLPGAGQRMADLLHLVYPDRPASWSKELADAFTLPGLPDAAGEGESCIPCSWDEREWPEMACRSLGAARDRNFLDWRYTRHPVFSYRFLSLDDGERRNLAVWRMETIRRQGPDGLEDIERIGRLVEFLPASPAGAAELFACFLQQLHAEGALGADYYGYYGPHATWLGELGFRPCTLHPDGGLIPSRFQPLDGKGGAIFSAMFAQESVSPCSAGPDCAWYWTKADSDQDRPN